MKLDQEALKKACLEIARSTMWKRRPVDNDEIERLAEELTAIAVEQVRCCGEGRDPNVVTRAVGYLAVLAIPPMSDDTRWFNEAIQVLLELAWPTGARYDEHEEFFRDIENGIAEARASHNDQR